MTIEVRAPSDPNEVNDAQNTYYSALNFNQGQIGGGYAGIQYSSDGEAAPYYDSQQGKWIYSPGPLFIYSLWDTNSDNPTVEYLAPGKMHSESFGGEGTGMKTWSSGKREVEFDFEWDDWNTLTLRSWNCDGGSCYGFWVKRGFDNQWHHLSRLKVSQLNRGFHTANGSFLEDWSGSGDKRRETNLRQAWRRSMNTKTWCEYGGPLYSVNANDRASGGRSANYPESYNGGIGTDPDGSKYWYMISGGSAITPKTTHHGSYMASLNQGGTQPAYATGEVQSWDVQSTGSAFEVTWEPNTQTLPQFSVELELFEDDNLIDSYTDTLPERVEYSFNQVEDPSKVYRIRLTYTDIFDQSQVYEKSLNDSTLSLHLQAYLGLVRWGQSQVSVLETSQVKLYRLDGSLLEAQQLSPGQAFVYPQEPGAYLISVSPKSGQTLKKSIIIR